MTRTISKLLYTYLTFILKVFYCIIHIYIYIYIYICFNFLSKIYEYHSYFEMSNILSILDL